MTKPLPKVSEYYADDHDRLDGLFHSYQQLKPTDFAGAVRAFQEFRTGLERHIVWEEQILFPAFDRRFGRLGPGPTAVMRWEHQQIRQHLTAIAQKLAEPNGETEEEELALLAVLCPHNQKEEGILYPTIDQILTGPEREQIFTVMEQVTRTASQDGPPGSMALRA